MTSPILAEMTQPLRVCIAVVVFGLAPAAATASASQQTIPGRIIPGVGMGKLRLGMSEQAAKRVLAPLGSRKFVRRVNAGKPDEYIEFEYPNPTVRWDLVTAYTIGFQGRRGKRRVAVIEVNLPRNRTAGGIGVGTREKKLLLTYPNLRCERYLVRNNPRTECVLGPRTRRHTVFVVKASGLTVSGRPPPPPPSVSRIILREPGVPLGP